MHLRRSKHQEQQQSHSQQHYAPKVRRVEESDTENSFNWDRLSFPKEIRELAAKRKILHKKIHEIENRLRFGYSEALYTYKMELVREDVELCCKMTNHLLALKKDRS